MSKSSGTYTIQPLHAVVAMAVICSVHQSGYALETTDAPVTKPRQRTLFDRQLGQFDLQTDPKPNPFFDDLSDTDKGHLEELWKAILNAPTATRLKQRKRASLYDFEKEYWRIFDNVILQRSSFTAAKRMGMSLTEPSLEPDYPRYGEQAVPYNFGKVYSKRTSSSGAAIGASGILGANRHSLDPLSQEITEVLKTLVINYKLYKDHLKDVESSSRDASRRALVDLAGGKAVSEMETLLRQRKL